MNDTHLNIIISHSLLTHSLKARCTNHFPFFALQGMAKVMRKRKLLPEVYAKAEAHFAIFTVD